MLRTQLSAAQHQLDEQAKRSQQNVSELERQVVALQAEIKASRALLILLVFSRKPVRIVCGVNFISFKSKAGGVLFMKNTHSLQQ